MVNKEELIEILKKYGFTQEQISKLTKNKTLLKQGIIDKIDKNLQVLTTNNISLEKIAKCSIILFKNNYLEIKKIFEVLEKHQISKETIENCLSVLASGKANEIEKIFEVLETHQISKETIEKCLTVLARGKANEIEKILNVLEDHQISKETIEKCLTVLALGKASEIKKILNVLEDHQISKETIEKCLYVLALGKASEIEKILNVLEDHQISKETIEKCLTVLAKGKANEIEKIFETLEKHQISKETIEKCLTVLALGKASEIEKIFEVLEKHQISKETIEKCLTVLAKGKASEIEKMFEVLDKYHISKENIEKNFGNIFSKSINKFDAIFSRNSENIKMYMKLKGYYDKIVTKEELNQIAQFKNVDTEKIICSVLNQKYIETYKKTIEEKGGLYIGKSIPMNKNDMSKYENIILDISKNISNLMSYKYKYDKQELESFCISTLIEKCGDVIYNNDVNKEFLYGTLYNKTKKYCIGYILKEKNNYSIDISKWENTTKTSKYNKSGMVKKDELDVKQWNLKSEEDEEAMKILSNYLEMGYDNKKAFENTAKDLELDIEELMYNIEEIKNQILNKNKENNEQEKDEK